jgi:hypothetical protein
LNGKNKMADTIWKPDRIFLTSLDCFGIKKYLFVALFFKTV